MTLTDEERRALARYVRAKGVLTAAKTLHLSRETLTRLVGRVPVRYGSLVVARAAIARFLAGDGQ